MTKWLLVAAVALAGCSSKEDENKAKLDELQHKAQSATQRALDKAHAVGDKVSEKADAVLAPLRRELDEVQKKLYDIDIKMGLASDVAEHSADAKARAEAQGVVTRLETEKAELERKIAELRARLGL